MTLTEHPRTSDTHMVSLELNHSNPVVTNKLLTTPNQFEFYLLQLVKHCYTHNWR